MTEDCKYSHGQNIVDCFLEGYGWESRRHRPKMDVVSVYARTMLLMEGLVHDITAAARLENQRDPLSFLFYLGSGHAITQLLQPASDDRVTMAGIESLWLAQKPLDTPPHLAIECQVGRESTFVST